MRQRPNDRVAILAYDGLRTFEFGIAVELFALARPELDRWYDAVVAGVGPGPLRATGGVTVQPSAGLEAVEAAGTVVVPGWTNLGGPLEPRLREALLACVQRGGRVVGICSGAFALAQAGLLDGRRATTHWAYADELARRFPRVRVDVDALYVDEDVVLTSAGSAAGIDAGLHLVREDRGADVAAVVARRLVMAPHRDGGQAQFSSRPSGGTDDAWLQRQRVGRALELLAGTDLPVEQVATRVGLGSGAALRHHLRRQLGTTPTAYRRRFAAGA